ncbi:MAG: ABC transporter permease [Dehalococcoidia bacterium]|nr:ABC transporter permease [Dehalococcoidia bacterium]
MAKTKEIVAPILGEEARGHSPMRAAWQRLFRNRVALASLGFLTAMLLVGILAPWIAPYSYSDQNLNIVQQSPSFAHWLGTDSFGRDLLSRIMWGSRTAFMVATVVVTVSSFLGIMFGAAAGYFGRWVDTAIMRFSDFLFAFPGLLLAILLAATVRPTVVAWTRQVEGSIGMTGLSRTGIIDYLVVFLALSTLGWAGLARLVRGQVLSLKQKDFVEAARAVGASPWRIIWRHILPNTIGVLLVALSMGMGGAIMGESVLSFIGLGIKPPNPSWGAMIDEEYGYWRTHAHLVFVPGGIVALVIFAFNFLGDGLNDAFNPKSGEGQ